MDITEEKECNLLASKFMDIREASKFLGISKSSIYSKTSRRIIPFYKPKGCKKLYFNQSELENWIKKGKKNPVEFYINELNNKNE